MRLPVDVPIELGRAEAQRQALAELSKPAYHAARPSWVQRLLDQFLDWVGGLAQQAASAAPGGFWGLVGIAAMIVLTVVAVRWRLGPVSHTARLEFAVDPLVTAAEYRARAELFAAAGNWDEAITERMRAIARGCEERGIVAARPGRTADEFATEVGVVLPATGADLRRAASLFDSVRYGNRPGNAAAYQQVREADEQVAAAVPARRSAPAVALP
ncbi:MAG: DUF4129 domain-containing protein [Candidatus Nanopelagicales bacterium]